MKISSHNEFLPVCLEVAEHKVTGRLIVCLAVQKLSKEESEQEQENSILIYEFD
jgi:hypothetical protein